MIPARHTRLLRAADLAAYRQHLIDLTRGLTSETAADTFVLVPTEAAAAQLRRTLRDRAASAPMPVIGSRNDLYDHLASRITLTGRKLLDIEREAILAASARETETAGHAAPFHVRPALVAEMLALYDRIRLLGRTIDDFDRLLTGELEPAAESDRGAAQLLEQTAFLSVAFRTYETLIADGRALDEHGVRAQIAATQAVEPLRHLVIAVGDRPFDPDGYWPADVALFTTLRGLERLDVLSTDAVLEAGFIDRVQHAFVEIELTPSAAASRAAVLIAPPQKDDELVFSYRDREDELDAAARRLKSQSSSLDRAGLVVARPLPYLYLAREIFTAAGVPFEALDTLPLAAEPYSAAVDLVLECAAANFTRRALMALLRSPHFSFAIEPGIATSDAAGRQAIGLLDTAMASNRYLGGLDRLRALTETLNGRERAAAATALAIAIELAPLLEPRPLAEQAELLRDFLERHNRPFDSPGSAEPGSLRGFAADRRRRAKAAVLTTIAALAEALRRQDPDAEGTVTELAGAVRRWLGAQTFAADAHTGGVRIVDAQAARFAELDDVQIMGLVEGEWPERSRRNIFYPRALIAQLEPSKPDRIDLTSERDQVRAARAVFRDLAGLAARRTRLSTFALEADSVVEPSTFIDDLPSFGLVIEREPSAGTARPFEQLPVASPATDASPWALARARNADREASRFTGEAGDWVLPRVSVSRLERYLKCPFQFYVSNVLQVSEEPEDENSRSPLERGRFLHELFETFFHEWQARGRGRITSREMNEARSLFQEIAEPALRSLPPAEAGLERARLFGSAVGSGIADRVFAMEAERGVEIRERLMEYELDGEFTFTGEDGEQRAVRLRAKIDRVDVLGDGTFRLIDYKTKYVPDRRTALQLPIYSACVRTSLSKQHGRDVAASEAMYLSFEGPQAVVALEERGKVFDELTEAAGHRLVGALNDIARGYYPPKPESKNLCSMCRFTLVCRTEGGLDE